MDASETAWHGLAMMPFIGFLLTLLTYLGPIALAVILWRKLSVKPTRVMVVIAVFWCVVGVVASVLPDLKPLWYGLLGLWAFIAIVDLAVVLSVRPLRVERKLPSRFALGELSEVELTIHNPSVWPLSVELYDGVPEEARTEGLPWLGRLPRRGFTQITYPVELTERGDTHFEATHIGVSTLLRLWSRHVRAGEAQDTRVYPNYEPVIRFALLTMESSPEQMGIVMKNRAGMSKEFHQLRDYHLGDMLSQIDWKATSKRRSLISRSYQEQRDQNVILAVDCGRRMRALDGGLPQFDHCLNAMLLLAYVALRQGDQVGIMGFGGETKWLPPVKGTQSMTTILNHLYDYQTSTVPTDFTEAAETLLANQRRRALVVVLSNIRGEDSSELVEPLRKLRQRHVVMVANLREQAVMDRISQEAETLDDALAVSSAQLYLEERKGVLDELASHGVHTVDATAKELPVALANRYLTARESV